MPRGCGGIGRRARLRIWWVSVQVQVLSPAPKEKDGSKEPSFLCLLVFRGGSDLIDHMNEEHPKDGADGALDGVRGNIDEGSGKAV